MSGPEGPLSWGKTSKARALFRQRTRHTGTVVARSLLLQPRRRPPRGPFGTHLLCLLSELIAHGVQFFGQRQVKTAPR
jgi:hypothetical protein